MTDRAQLDEARMEEFADRAVGDFSSTMTVMLCHVGDRLGLFEDLHADGPATPAELAERTGLDERYVAEWLRGLRAPGYLDYDEDSGRYELSPEHAMVLAAEGSPVFLGGGYQVLGGIMEPIHRIVDAFEDGGGAAQDAYGHHFWAGMERFSSGWLENFLLEEWIPAMPDVEAKLESGCRYADVGCGSGRALNKLARSFPDSTFVGYDLFPTQAERARENVEASGVGGRVEIEVADASEGLPETYDVISTFDVVHDAVDPLGLLEGIRGSLDPDGVYVCLDVNCADTHEENEGPLAAMFYGFSVFYCMTTSLANGGAGLGTSGFPEAKCQELSEKAGFSEVRQVPIDDSFNSLYEIRP